MTVTYKEYPEHKLVEIGVDGKVTSEAFDHVADKMETFIALHGKVKIIEIITDFDGFDWDVIGKGIKFDFEHLKDFSHCAVVTDSGWIGPFTRMLSPLFTIQIKTFPMSDIELARAWIKTAT